MFKHLLRVDLKAGWMVPLVVLVVAALACGPLGGGGGDEASTPEASAGVMAAEATPAPAVEAAATPEPAKPTTPPEASTPAPESGTGGITAKTAGSLEVLRYGTVSETALLAAAASPTTHEFATFGYDKVVRIWDADSGNLLRELTGSGEYGFGLAYSPDGTRLASTGGYHVYIWDPVKGSLVHDVVINSFGFRVVWSPDGSRLAVVGDGSSKIEFIDAAKGVLLSEETLRNPAGRILWAVAYSPDGSWLGTADGDGRVHVVDAATGDILFEDTQATRGAAWDLEFSPDGALLASCHKGGGVFVWNTSDWSVALSGNDIFTGGCTDGTFSVGSDVYFAVGADGQFYGWDMSAGGDPLVNFSAPVQLWMISVSGDGTFIVAAVDNGTAAVIGLK